MRLRYLTTRASGSWGLRPHTPVCDTFELQYTSFLKHVSQFRHFCILTIRLIKSSPLNEFLVTCKHQATASDLSFYNTFAPTKNSSFEVSDDVIACDLWFGGLQSKILATPLNSSTVSNCCLKTAVRGII